MNTYSDNQTGHLYVMNNASSPSSGTDYTIGTAVNNMFNINIGGHITDTIDKKHVIKTSVAAVKPVYYRRWQVNPMTSLVGNTRYSLYFYLENTIGFGINDRTDIAVSYDAPSTSSDDTAINTAMASLKNDLNNAINTKGYGSIVNDFIVTMLDSSLSVADATMIFGVQPTSTTTATGSESLTKANGTNSGKKYSLTKIVGATETKYVFDDSPVDLALNGICVLENPNSATYSHTNNEIMIGAHPYEYDLTLSTYEDNTNATWGTGNGRRIYAENTSTVRFGSGVIVKDMENFFMRNRADLYSLSPNFNASIINDLKANESYAYSMVNIHYAFSDNLGFSYLSEKDINIAVKESAEGNTTNGSTLLSAINAAL